LRRTLELISLGLFLLGLELAAGTLSLTTTRLRETLAFRVGSTGPEGVPWTSLAGIGLTAVAVVLMGLTIFVRFGERRVVDHVGCPVCGTRTNRVRRKVQERILGRVVGKAMSARHCGDCGWRGLSYLR